MAHKRTRTKPGKMGEIVSKTPTLGGKIPKGIKGLRKPAPESGYIWYCFTHRDQIAVGEGKPFQPGPPCPICGDPCYWALGDAPPKPPKPVGLKLGNPRDRMTMRKRSKR